MNEIDRIRKEIEESARALNETIIENLASAHVAATLAAPQVATCTATEAVGRYRAILAELYKLGPFKGVAG